MTGSLLSGKRKKEKKGGVLLLHWLDDSCPCLT